MWMRILSPEQKKDNDMFVFPINGKNLTSSGYTALNCKWRKKKSELWNPTNFTANAQKATRTLRMHSPEILSGNR